MAIDSGIYSDILAVNANDNEAQNVAKAKAIDKLNKQYFLDPIWATKVISWLVVHLDWSSNTSQNKSIVPNSSSNNSKETNTHTSSEIIKRVYVGDIICFGKYYQDDCDSRTAIEWEVIAVDDDQALLLSTHCLDTKWYNDSKSNVSWEISVLRDWLNNYFINKAFTEKEQLSIVAREVPQSINPRSTTTNGNKTIDSIFILSCEEVRRYNLDITHMRCRATLLAKKNGIYYVTESNYAAWWLRTLGYTTEKAMYVMKNGCLDELGDMVNSRNKGVRPALWVDLKAL